MSNSTITVICFSFAVSACATMVTVHCTRIYRMNSVFCQPNEWIVDQCTNLLRRKACVLVKTCIIYEYIYIVNTVRFIHWTLNDKRYIKHTAFTVSLSNANSISKWHANDWFQDNKHIGQILFHHRIIHGSIETHALRSYANGNILFNRKLFSFAQCQAK